MNKPTISFEYFPPKTDKAEEAFWQEVPHLAALKPNLMTVTYGAGGSTKEKTIETATALQEQTKIPIAAHLTYINTLIAELDDITSEIWDAGIRHIIALRGDLPPDLSWPLDVDENYYQRTSDFVRALKDRHDFEISVAAYPEKHPDAPSLDADIQSLKKKCDAGADRAITQFFFDNDCYYAFLDQCRNAGITTPIYPGILPIHDFPRMVGFAEKCQANVPDWLHEKFSGLEDKPEEAYKVACDLLTAQTLDLAENGIQHIHYYTLNKAPITLEACKALGY